jgi:fibronectin-binding autotransporter adhesin
VFQIDGGVTASISGLTISGGKTTGNGGGLANDNILTFRTLILRF